MQILRKLFVVILLLTATITAYARESINGAFGVEIGSTLSDSVEIIDLGGIKPEENINFRSSYFEPKIPNELFSSYKVMISNRNDRVIGIEATNFISGKSSCISALKNLGNFLANKYGDSSEVHESGGRGEKVYSFVLMPSSSTNIIAGACQETNLEAGGFYERGFFYDDEEVEYYFKVVYGAPVYLDYKNGVPDKSVDSTGL